MIQDSEDSTFISGADMMSDLVPSNDYLSVPLLSEQNTRHFSPLIFMNIDTRSEIFTFDRIV